MQGTTCTNVHGGSKQQTCKGGILVCILHMRTLIMLPSSLDSRLPFGLLQVCWCLGLVFLVPESLPGLGLRAL